MKYTDEEVAVLKENTKQIEQYIRRLIPSLRESIHIEFGNIVDRRGCYGLRVWEKQFELHISSSGIVGGSGGLRYDFDRKERPYHTDGIIDLYNDRGFGVEYMASLCENWQGIKREINNAVSKQAATADKIKNFVL